jgi:hypothetical protein
MCVRVCCAESLCWLRGLDKAAALLLLRLPQAIGAHRPHTPSLYVSVRSAIALTQKTRGAGFIRRTPTRLRRNAQMASLMQGLPRDPNSSGSLAAAAAATTTTGSSISATANTMRPEPDALTTNLLMFKELNLTAVPFVVRLLFFLDNPHVQQRLYNGQLLTEEQSVELKEEMDQLIKAVSVRRRELVFGTGGAGGGINDGGIDGDSVEDFDLLGYLAVGQLLFKLRVFTDRISHKPPRSSTALSLPTGIQLFGLVLCKVACGDFGTAGGPTCRQRMAKVCGCSDNNVLAVKNALASSVAIYLASLLFIVPVLLCVAGWWCCGVRGGGQVSSLRWTTRMYVILESACPWLPSYSGGTHAHNCVIHSPLLPLLPTASVPPLLLFRRHHLHSNTEVGISSRWTTQLPTTPRRHCRRSRGRGTTCCCTTPCGHP